MFSLTSMYSPPEPLPTMTADMFIAAIKDSNDYINSTVLAMGETSRLAVVLSQSQQYLFTIQLVVGTPHQSPLQPTLSNILCVEGSDQHQLQQLTERYLHLLQTLETFCEQGGNISEDIDASKFGVRRPQYGVKLPGMLYYQFHFPSVIQRRPLHHLEKCIKKINQFNNGIQERQRRRDDEQNSKTKLEQQQREHFQRQQPVYEALAIQAVQTAGEQHRRHMMHQLIDQHPELTVEEVFARIEQELPYSQ